MLIGIKLTPHIKCEHICSQIQKLLEIYQKSDTTENSLLVIRISKIIDNDNSLIKNLEYKN
jgi:hypothetical protein